VVKEVEDKPNWHATGLDSSRRGDFFFCFFRGKLGWRPHIVSSSGEAGERRGPHRFECRRRACRRERARKSRTRRSYLPTHWRTLRLDSGERLVALDGEVSNPSHLRGDLQGRATHGPGTSRCTSRASRYRRRRRPSMVLKWVPSPPPFAGLPEPPGLRNFISSWRDSHGRTSLPLRLARPVSLRSAEDGRSQDGPASRNLAMASGRFHGPLPCSYPWRREPDAPLGPSGRTRERNRPPPPTCVRNPCRRRPSVLRRGRRLPGLRPRACCPCGRPTTSPDRGRPGFTRH